MDLLRSWAVGLVVWIVASLLSTTLVANVATLDIFNSLGGRIPVDYLPSCITLACVAAAAALLHAAPARSRVARHSAAALGVPALSVTASVVLIGVNGPPVSGTAAEALVGTILAGLVGGFTGWQLADRLRPTAM